MDTIVFLQMFVDKSLDLTLEGPLVPFGQGQPVTCSYACLRSINTE